MRIKENGISMGVDIQPAIVLFVISIIMLLSIGTASGVPSDPRPFPLTQPDNHSFQARQVGDERGAHFETMDGYTTVKDNANWWNYARKDEKGKLVSTGQRIGFSDSKKPGLPKHLHPDLTVTELTPGQGQVIRSPVITQSRISPPAMASQVGAKKALVILINFQDKIQGVDKTPAYYDNLLFNASPGANSMNNYYKEVSYNKMSVTGSVAGSKWYTSSYNMAYYGQDGTGIDNYYGGSYRLICEAVSLANADIDYSQYDGNGDGYIDNIIVVHAGSGQESSVNSTDIWSSMWSGNLCGSTFDGKLIYSGTILAESSPLGTFAHEFGHNLGLPDLYDTDYTSNGVGDWDIMAFGSWGNGGNTPAHFSAWSKYFLGWVNPAKVTASRLNEQINNSETYDDIYMLRDNPGDGPGNLDWTWVGTGTGEYFLVENRRQTGYDAYLPGEGLLIWHIDESMPGNTNENHKLVDLEEADGQNHLDNKINYGDINDPWYNSTTGFTESTTPNSNLYSGFASGIRVTNIGPSASIMTTNLVVGWPPPAITFIPPTPANNTTVTLNWAYVMIISDEFLSNAVLEWNGVNETMPGAGITWYLNKTNLAEGVYSYRVLVNDSTGNSNASQMRYVTVNTPPAIIFISPTPANNSLITQNWVYINITSDQLLNSALLEWNSVNESMLGSGNNWYENKTLSDGTYVYRVWGCDNSSICSVTGIRMIMVDTTPLVVTANTPGYPSGFSAARNGSTITLNASISDALSGVKNATVNASQVNQDLKDIVLSYSSGFWTNSSVIVNSPDGTYKLNITAYDNAGNLNNTAQITVIVDNTRPDVTVNPTSYQRGIAANNGSIITFNVTADDPVINSTSSGLRNASVNTALINNTGWITLTSQGGFWKGSAVFNKYVPDGNYSLDVSFYDNAGNINNSERVNITLDNTPPSITAVSVLPALVETGSSTYISATVTDDLELNTSDVYARIKYPNGTSIDYHMTYIVNTSFFGYTFTDTAQYGRFNVTVIANDTAGNTNSGTTWFVTTKSNSSLILVHGGYRGDTANNSNIWNIANFSGLAIEETLNVQNVSNRTILLGNLWYNTTRQVVNYTLHEANSSLLVENALDSSGNKVSLNSSGGYYAKVGWHGIPYVAFDGKANKTSLLVLEQSSSLDKKTLMVGETWEMGDGFTLTAMAIDAKATPRLVWFELFKDGTKLDDKVSAQGDVYTFSKNISGKYVPLFVTYVDSIFAGATSDMVQIKYTWLISDNVTAINAGDIFGNLAVNQSDDNSINLTNSNNNISLPQNSDINLMYSLHFGVMNNESLGYYPFFTAPTYVNDTGTTNVTLEIFRDSGAAGSVKVTRQADIPSGMNRSLPQSPFGKYISIETNNNIINNRTWIKFKIYYTKAELDASGLQESSLKIAWYNKSDLWETLNTGSQAWVYGTGADIIDAGSYAGYLWANVSDLGAYDAGAFDRSIFDLGTFALIGMPIQQNNNNNGGGGSGGGGGGGGGTSGENYTNIEIKEKYDLYIFKDKSTSYKFTNNSSPIVYVNITGNISPGEINTMIEVLRNTSSLVNSSPPGIVYKNVNIWVGTSGFAVPKNIKSAEITFKVRKEWAERVNPDSIALYHYDSQWNKLPTLRIRDDTEYYYYQASTDKFSPFAISAENKVTAGMQQAIKETPQTNIPVVEKGPSNEKTSSGMKPSVLILTGLGAVLTSIVVLLARRLYQVNSQGQKAQ